MDQSRNTIFFYILLVFCFVGLVLFFMKAVKHRKAYEAVKTIYHTFPHSKNVVEEDPVEIVSRFREDSMKQGVTEGAFDLKGQVRSLFTKINGSLHGASKATPAVDKSGVYVGSDNGWFYKLNHRGKLIWKTYFAKTGQGVHGTALLSKEYLWVGAYNGILYCLKKETGEVVWSIDLGGAIGASPSFYKGQIIISVELLSPRAMGYIASVSAKRGSLNWKTPLTLAHIHSSVAIHPEKGYGVVGANNGLLFKIDLKSGRLLWTLPLKGAIKSTPLIYNNHIYVTNWGNEFAAVSEAGRIIWTKDTGNRSQSSPTLIPDKGYLIFATHGEGKLFAVSAETGEIVWKKKIETQRAVGSGVSFFSRRDKRYKLLFPCKKEAVCVINPANGDVLKKIQTGFLLTGGFAFFKKHFYIAVNNGGVFALY